MMKTKTERIDHRNGDKAPLRCEKQDGLWEHGLLPMDKEIRNFGQNHLRNDNDLIQQKQ